MSDEKVRDVTGVIDVIIAPTTRTTKKDGTLMKQPLHSIGIKLADGTWNNIQSFDSQEKCLEVLNKANGGGKFVKGDNVVMTEESTVDGKYPHIVSISLADQVAEEMVRTNEEIAMDQDKGRVIGEVKGETIVSSHNENQIEKQCCLKVASMLGGIQSKEDCLSAAKWFYANLGTQWLE